MQYKTNTATPHQYRINQKPFYAEDAFKEEANPEQAHHLKNPTDERRHHFSQGLALLSLISMPLAQAEETHTHTTINQSADMVSIGTMQNVKSTPLHQDSLLAEQRSFSKNVSSNENAIDSFIERNILTKTDFNAATTLASNRPRTLEDVSQEKSKQLAQKLLPSARDAESSRNANAAWDGKTTGAFRSLGYDFSVTAKAHTGNFDWSIASDMTGTRTPNVLSELSYEALDINVLTYDYVKRFSLTKSFTGRLEVSYSKGGIDNGTVYDADYFSDDRTGQKSLSASDPAGSDISAQQITLGISRNLTEHTQFTLLGGYAQNNQAFVKRQGLQLFSARTAGVPAEGTTFNNLNSTYQTTWKSGFVGSQLTHITGAHRFNIRAEFHGADYYAEADWNLRSAFQHPKSFEHIANGSGLNTQFSYTYALDRNLQLTVSANRERWQTRDGLDRVFLASGQTVTTRLLETNWESTGYGIGITYTGGL